MATTTIVTLIDSINGSTEDVETVTFFHPMTGQKMTIELDEKNRKAMGTHLERMSKYFDAAEAVVEAAPAKPKAAKNDENVKIRKWAQENGFAIGDRGRISAEIKAAYAAAHNVIEKTLESAIENSGNGNVADLGDFTQFVEEGTEPAESEAEATVALDGETQVLSDKQTDSDNVELSDDDIIKMMREVEAESGEVTLDALVDKVNEDN